MQNEKKQQNELKVDENPYKINYSDIKHFKIKNILKKNCFSDFSLDESIKDFDFNKTKIAISLKKIGFDDFLSIALASKGLSFGQYEDIIKDFQNNYRIYFQTNQQTKDDEVAASLYKKDDEFDTFLEIKKRYEKDGKTKISRTTHSMPKLTIENNEYYINGLRTYVNVNKAGEKPDLSINMFGRWVINGEETDIYSLTKKSNTSYVRSRQTLEIEYTDLAGYKNIDNSFETKVFSDGKIEIIHTKKSELLKGTYEITRYTEKDFVNFPKSTNIIEEIKKGNVQGEKLSTINEDENGSITLNENFERNGYHIKRIYKQNKNSSEYSYHIKDKNDNYIFKLDRSFFKNSDNETTTIINGKKYKAFFNDSCKVIKIVDENNKETILNITSKMDYRFKKDMSDFFDFAKNLPVDQLLKIKDNIWRISVSHNNKASYNNGKINVPLNNNSIFHEIGHSVDYKENHNKPITEINQELKDIYTDEMKKFCAEYTEEYQDIIKYFGFQGGGDVNNGLSEFFAEVNLLCATYGSTDLRYATRSQFIVRYFPKTFAKIAQILGYNSL